MPYLNNISALAMCHERRTEVVEGGAHEFICLYVLLLNLCARSSGENEGGGGNMSDLSTGYPTRAARLGTME